MAKIDIENIAVELIHADPWQKLVKEAWLNSRPHLHPEDIDPRAVLDTDAPIADIPAVVVAMRIPIFIREIVCSMRDPIVWARSSRVDKLTERWTVSPGTSREDMDRVEELFKKMTYAVNYGMAQDNYRLHLPLSYMTELTVKMSIRALVKLRSFVTKLATELEGKVCADLFVFGNELEDVLGEIGGLRELKYGEEDFLPRLRTHPYAGMVDWIGDFLVVRIETSLSLRSHVVRHRYIQFADTFRDFLESTRLYFTPISEMMYMQLVAPAVTWQKIAAKRNCWLAQTDLWEPILKLVNPQLSDLGLALPCADGACPYVEDNRQRKIGNDPGVPCPREMQLAGEAIDTKTLVRMDKYIMDSRRDEEFWNDQILETFKRKTE